MSIANGSRPQLPSSRKDAINSTDTQAINSVLKRRKKNVQIQAANGRQSEDWDLKVSIRTGGAKFSGASGARRRARDLEKRAQGERDELRILTYCRSMATEYLRKYQCNKCPFLCCIALSNTARNAFRLRAMSSPLQHILKTPCWTCEEAFCHRRQS